MIKKFSVRKIIIATLLLLVAIILYNFPKELEENIHDAKLSKINIYVIDSNNYVAMTSVLSNKDSFDEKLKTIIDSLTTGKNQLPENFDAILPKGTKIIDYSIDDSLLKINFSKELLNVTQENEDKMIQCLIYSLTTLENIDKIMIFVENKLLQELPHSHKRLNTYLDRTYGINKVIDITKITDTKMVTVYYLANNTSNYYIPISHVVNSEEEKIEIIIESLRSNTLNSSQLSSHLDYQVELMNYDKVNNEFLLNFNSALLNSVYDGKLKEEIKYALSYSIYDTYNIENVVFQVNSNKIDELRLAK